MVSFFCVSVYKSYPPCDFGDILLGWPIIMMVNIFTQPKAYHLLFFWKNYKPFFISFHLLISQVDKYKITLKQL